MRRVGPPARRVVLTTDPTQATFDRYGRLLAYARVPAGTLQLFQLNAGWARVYVFSRPFRRVGRSGQLRTALGRPGAVFGGRAAGASTGPPEVSYRPGPSFRGSCSRTPPSEASAQHLQRLGKRPTGDIEPLTNPRHRPGPPPVGHACEAAPLIRHDGELPYLRLRDNESVGTLMLSGVRKGRLDFAGSPLNRRRWFDKTLRTGTSPSGYVIVLAQQFGVDRPRGNNAAVCHRVGHQRPHPGNVAGGRWSRCPLM